MVACGVDRLQAAIDRPYGVGAVVMLRIVVVSVGVRPYVRDVVDDTSPSTQHRLDV